MKNIFMLKKPKDLKSAGRLLKALFCLKEFIMPQQLLSSASVCAPGKCLSHAIRTEAKDQQVKDAWILD